MKACRITLRQLQIFAAVGRAGSTNAAARAVALSQSATSAALNQLERVFGLKLFDRVGKGLQLNENGRMLMPEALAVLDGASGLERWAVDDQVRTGALRIGASTTIGNYLLPSILARHRNRLPHALQARWQAQVVIANTAAITEQVANFDLDVGLIEGPCHRPELTASPWMEDELVIVSAKNDPILSARRKTVSIKMLRAATWLLREPGSGTREVTDQLLIPHLHHVNEGISFANSEAIKYATVNGLGITCLSRYVVADLVNAGALVVLPTTLPKFTRKLHIVLHEKKLPTQGLSMLLQTLRAAPPVVLDTDLG